MNAKIITFFILLAVFYSQEQTKKIKNLNDKKTSIKTSSITSDEFAWPKSFNQKLQNDQELNSLVRSISNKKRSRSFLQF